MNPLQYPYQKLIVWQVAMDLAVYVYKITRNFPPEERYNLTDQMRRAAVSVPSNIAEGRTRGSDSDFIHFLHISRGSCAELETQLLLSYRLEFLSEEMKDKGLKLCHEISYRISKLILALRK
ncbi:MAG: four helix bundle protein [Acidaminococcus sp.]|nr:four helix bundle protein [Acidaminococcus sp.]